MTNETSWFVTQVTLPDSLTMDGNGGAASPSDFHWMTGTTSDGRRQYVVVSERPIPTFRECTKEQLERACVERFRLDSRRFGKSDPYFFLSQNPEDPPDFFLELRKRGGRVGLECTLFTSQQRRMLHARFQSVQNRLLSAPPGTYRHLAYRLVQVDFGRHNVVPRSEDDPVVEEIADALARLRPDPAIDADELILADRDEWPHRTPSGVGLDIAHLHRGYKPSSFARRTGFDLAMSNGTIILDADELRGDLEKAVRRKDRDGNDWLLVSAGAPSRTGDVLPGDSLLLRAAIMGREPLTDLTHLRRVIVHSWYTGCAWEVYPEARELFQYESPSGSSIHRMLIGDLDLNEMWARTGRNSPCPCNSGKKHKHCCLK